MVGTADHKGDFAFRRVGGEMCGEGFCGTAAVVFEGFGQFAGDANGAVRAVLVEHVEGADNAVGGLEIDAGFGAFRGAQEF